MSHKGLTIFSGYGLHYRWFFVDTSFSIFTEVPFSVMSPILREKQAKLIVMSISLMFPAPLASGRTLPLSSEGDGSRPKQVHVRQLHRFLLFWMAFLLLSINVHPTHQRLVESRQVIATHQQSLRLKLWPTSAKKTKWASQVSEFHCNQALVFVLQERNNNKSNLSVKWQVDSCQLCVKMILL